MSLPGNGIFVLRGEISTVMTAIKRWNCVTHQEEERERLMKDLIDTKNLLQSIEDLRLVEPNVFVAPFLEVLRSAYTPGQITSLALSALNKFLSYGLIDPTNSAIAITVESIADAANNARFSGSDQTSNDVVLMKIVQVLRTLMLSPEGSALTNESVCEVLLSCFRICFQLRLNELLRRAAEHALKDIILLLFMRLPQFAEERHAFLKKLKMPSGNGLDASNSNRRKSKSITKATATTAVESSAPPKQSIPAIQTNDIDAVSPKPTDNIDTATTPNQTLLGVQKSILATTPSTPVTGNIVDMQGKFMQTPHTVDAENIEVAKVASSESIDSTNASKLDTENVGDCIENDADADDDSIGDDSKQYKKQNSCSADESASTNLDASTIAKDTVSSALIPYGLPCIRELFRFLITLINPLDKQNTDAMIHMGLSLLTIALEVGADSIGKYDTLMVMVKDDLCRNLFSLLSTERITIFASDLQVCFLLFESQRPCLKFQVEYYLNKLAEIIGSENPRTPYEIRELALDNLLQFLRIPSFAAELYINYDCNLYCTNLLEDLIKLLSKNSFSATQAIYTVHEMSLDGLMTIISDIERNSAKYTLAAMHESRAVGVVGGRHSRTSSTLDRIKLEYTAAPIADTTNATQHEEGGGGGTIESIDDIIGRKNVSVSSVDDLNETISTDHRKQNDANIITHNQLTDIKNRKRVLMRGTELFNQTPEKGIQYLQENHYLSTQLDPAEVASFLRENSSLDKKMIGDYISKKKNVDSKILENFVHSFDFTDMRIDMALRKYLETFRLPGEAPLIFLVMEHFADHWHKLNKEPFADTDAAFSLAYSIIMLNMDQHNYNAKRLNIPMTAEDFCKNLRGVNGKGDFDQEMLAGIFNSIKNEEIVMPAEQTGLVRENYLWKVLLRRNSTKDGRYLRVNGATLDKDIFQLAWGPTLAALSFMFDKSMVDSAYHKSLLAFTKGAAIASHFKLHDDFNALILTLCKFTTLLNSNNGTAADGTTAHSNALTHGSNEVTTTVQFGLNAKAQLALKAVFAMVHKHGDCLRCDGWRNVIEVSVQLFKLKLLPKSLMEVEDFCEPNNKCMLLLEKPMQKQESMFSTLIMYLSSEGQRQPTHEEQQIVRHCVKDCHLDQIIGESKFLHMDALHQLVQCLLNWLKPPTIPKSENEYYAEDITVFLLEFLVKILIQNRDRLLSMWSDCRDQIYLLLLGSSTYGYNYLLVRTTVALLKLAIYLMRNEELCPVVLQSLKMFLLLSPAIIFKISRQISTGLYELLKTSAQNIHTESDWDIIFTLLECVGAGAIPPDYEEAKALTQAYQDAKSEGAISSCDEDEASAISQARGYTSDSEVTSRITSDASAALARSPPQENWIIVNKDSDVTATSRPTSPIHSLIHPCKLMRHSTFALVKCWDSLAFIVRNVAHITPYNFESCIKCIRTFVEASMNGGNFNTNVRKMTHNRSRQVKVPTHKRRDQVHSKLTLSQDSDGEDNELFQRYETISIQLLDLMHTLHTRTAQIFRWWAEESGSLPQCSALWELGWCPILQGIARLATDQRKVVRTSAITCLQRALLVHDLQTLSGPEWESCFKQVLFPLLYELLTEIPNANVNSNLLEESRMRAATIMSKVFLHHLTPLIALTTFNELWLDILDYIEKFMRVGSDMLHEAMLESLKNMLLVMHSVRVFHDNDSITHSPLWELTWKRIDQFLPTLREDLFDKEPMLTNSMQRDPVVSQQPITNQSISIVPQLVSTEATSQPTISTQQQSQMPVTPPQLPQPSGSITLDFPGNNCLIPNISLAMAASETLASEANNRMLDSNPLLLHQSQVSLSDVQPFLIPTRTSENIEPISSPQKSSTPVHSTQVPLQPVIDQSAAETDQAIIDFDDTEIDPYGSNVPQHVSTPPPSSASISPTDANIELSYSEPATIRTIEPKIPLSHLIAHNQYPSLNRAPPSNIVQSFPPVYVNANQPHANTIEELYSSYVNNPYNLTLHVEQAFSNDQMDDSLMATVAVPPSSVDTPTITETIAVNEQVMAGANMNVFQSATYFGASSDATIPPGSEMLFGQP